MSKTPQQLGKEFEKHVQDELMKTMKTLPTYCHRLYDSRSAGTYLPSQPGDFIFLCEGDAILIEVKSSGKYGSLAGRRTPITGLFDAQQIAQMRLWIRAGGHSNVIFQDQQTKAMELWDGELIVDTYLTDKAKLGSHQCWCYKRGQLDSLVAQLSRYFFV